MCHLVLTAIPVMQAIGRIHRMGQTRPVHVTRLVMHYTIEPRIRRYIERWVQSPLMLRTGCQ
jgi:hypothetical protein